MHAKQTEIGDKRGRANIVLPDLRTKRIRNSKKKPICLKKNEQSTPRTFKKPNAHTMPLFEQLATATAPAAASNTQVSASSDRSASPLRVQAARSKPRK